MPTDVVRDEGQGDDLENLRLGFLLIIQKPPATHCASEALGSDVLA
jgi:hypothetical protein